MSPERDDADLREAFQSLRRQDERLGLPFAGFAASDRDDAGRVRAGRSAADRRPLLRPRLAAAALACLLAAAAVVGTVRWLLPGLPATPRRADGAAAARLSAWRAPTDSLLEASAGQLLRGVPRLADSVVGGNGMGLAVPKTQPDNQTPRRR